MPCECMTPQGMVQAVSPPATRRHSSLAVLPRGHETHAIRLLARASPQARSFLESNDILNSETQSPGGNLFVACLSSVEQDAILDRDSEANSRRKDFVVPCLSFTERDAILDRDREAYCQWTIL